MRRRMGFFVMVDALGYNFLRTHEFLPELEYRVGLRTVLGYSCANQPTLFSGKLPHEHGHGAMFQLRDGPSVLDVAKPYAWLPSIVADNHRVRARIHGRVAAQVEGYFSLYDCPTRLLPRFDLVEKRSLFRPGGLRRARSIFDELESSSLSWRSYYWDRPEEENLTRAEEDIRGGEVDFVFLYLPRLDGLLHEQGSAGEGVHQRLGWYEERLRAILELLDEKVEMPEFFLFSDHGMSDVHGGVDLQAQVEAGFGRNGDRYLAFYDSTLGRFWVDDPALRSRLESLLTRVPGGRLLQPEEKAPLGVDFPDRSQGDLTWVADEGLIILPSYMGTRMLAGMHGYHPDAVDADACLLGPSAPSEDLAHIRDLHGLMLRVMERLEKDHD